MEEKDKVFMDRAIALAQVAIDTGMGGPFGCVVVKNGEIIAEGHNRVTGTNDPTAHAEVVAIRKACEVLESFQLEGCTIYTSCEPCPMCFGAIYWARPDAVFYGCTRQDAAEIDFDDQFIYDELDKEMGDLKIPFKNIMRSDARVIFERWIQKSDKLQY